MNEQEDKTTVIASTDKQEKSEEKIKVMEQDEEPDIGNRSTADQTNLISKDRVFKMTEVCETTPNVESVESSHKSLHFNLTSENNDQKYDPVNEPTVDPEAIEIKEQSTPTQEEPILTEK